MFPGKFAHLEKKVVENDAEVTKLDENLLGMEETLKMLAEKTSKMYIDGVLPQAIQNRVSTKEERLQCGFPLLPVPEGDADGAQASKARMVVSKMMWAVAREGERACRFRFRPKGRFAAYSTLVSRLHS